MASDPLAAGDGPTKTMSGDSGDNGLDEEARAHARDDFLAEAQGIVDALGRGVLRLGRGDPRPRELRDIGKEMLRHVHTLKGLAGLFGLRQLAELAHVVEELLDRLAHRPGGSRRAIDLLFQSVDAFAAIIGTFERGSSDAVPGLAELGAAIASECERLGETELPPRRAYALAAELLDWLSPTEERRLLAHAELGSELFELDLDVPKDHVERATDRARAIVAKHGELVACLPSDRGTTSGAIALTLLVVGAEATRELETHLGSGPGKVRAIALKAVPDATLERLEVSLTTTGQRALAGIDAQRAGRAVELSTSTSSGELAALSVRDVRSRVGVELRCLDLIAEHAALASTLVRDLKSTIDTEGGAESRASHIAKALDRHVEALSLAVVEARMVPIGETLERIARASHALALDAGKRVGVEIEGGDVKLDRLIADRLGPALVHLMRNAIDHGIERPDLRTKRGKDVVGSVKMRARLEATHVILIVEDDGAGVDESTLVSRAKSASVPTDALSMRALGLRAESPIDLVFLPGVSTAEDVGLISGRGVGLDIVRAEVARLGGTITAQSVRHEGTRFELRIPRARTSARSPVARV